jgi:phage N-6-adenine-methyltransferase
MRARNHPAQVKANGPNDEVDDRATHPMDFAEIAEDWGPFTIDVAAASHNTKCDRFYDRQQDGLAQSWAGETVWCNPPYSDIAPWVRKAWAEHQGTTAIVMLLPANRTEQSWWQLMVEPFRDRRNTTLTTMFLPGRMRFLKRGQTAIGPNERPPFGCVLLVWTYDPDATDAYDPDHVTGGLFS